MKTRCFLTHQEIFDRAIRHLFSYERVSAHLLTQRAVSEDENGSCRLRGGDGRKCAIGSLIRDDLYCFDIVRASASHTIGMHATVRC